MQLVIFDALFYFTFCCFVLLFCSTHVILKENEFKTTNCIRLLNSVLNLVILNYNLSFVLTLSDNIYFVDYSLIIYLL